MKKLVKMFVVLSIVAMAAVACTPKSEVKDETKSDSTAQVDSVVTTAVDSTTVAK